MKRLVIFQVLTFLFLSADIYATDLQVRIYADKNIKKFSFTTLSGSYKMIDDEHKFIIDIVQNESITFWVDGEKVKAMKNGIDLGSFNEIALNGEGLKTFFKITPDQKSVEERFYDDHLELSVENKFLRIINNVDLEHYIAGVIQSEVLGSSDDVEFFKIQAIISRTYAMNNMLKHFKDGYQLCDCVHCQAYKSRNNTPKILKAANETFGLVIVDEQKKMISAAFHSNSGGETVNSEDVWSSVTPYLKTVTDTFSLKARNAVWQKKYYVDEWFNFLSKTYNYDINDSVKRVQALNFTQDGRKLLFAGSIPLKNMRKDMDLKSTFFSVHKEGDIVILDGKGYGHGVGLSQEGAIEMIKRGYSVEEVLNFYYKNIEIININDLTSDDGLSD